MKQKKIGVNFLHRHIATEMRLGVPKDHVVVDKKDWELVVDYLNSDPTAIATLCGQFTIDSVGVIQNGELKTFDVREKLKQSRKPSPDKTRETYGKNT